MHDAPRYEAVRGQRLLRRRRGSRTPPTGTVARGWLRDDEALYTGKLNGQPVDAFPFAIAHDDLKRGQERFNIYCSPCHGRLGDGKAWWCSAACGRRRSITSDRLRQEQIGYFFDVITNGFGAMQGYAEQVPVRDRWLIAPTCVRCSTARTRRSTMCRRSDAPSSERAAADAPNGRLRPRAVEQPASDRAKGSSMATSKRINHPRLSAGSSGSAWAPRSSASCWRSSVS